MKKTKTFTLFLNLILVFLTFGFLFSVSKSLPPQLPLFYSLPWGEKQLATKGLIFLLPIFSLAVFLVNWLLPELYLLDEKIENDKSRKQFLENSLGIISLWVAVINLFSAVSIALLFL